MKPPSDYTFRFQKYIYISITQFYVKCNFTLSLYIYFTISFKNSFLLFSSSIISVFWSVLSYTILPSNIIFPGTDIFLLFLFIFLYLLFYILLVSTQILFSYNLVQLSYMPKQIILQLKMHILYLPYLTIFLLI